MGGKLGVGVRAVLAAAVAAALLFGVVEKVHADPTPYTVTIGNAPAQAEGDSPGQNKLTFPLTVAPGAAGTDITVTYTVDGGSAQTMTIAKGSASAQLQVPIAGDTKAEDDTTTTVVLTKVEFADDTTDTVALGATTTGKGNVIDDDWRIAGLASVPANATVTEAGNQVIDFQIKLVDSGGTAVNAPPNHKITVDYEVDDGTPAGLGSAVNGTNYTVTDPAGKTSGTLTFAPGTGVVHVKVQSKNDGVYGLDKQFTVSIKNPKGASFAAGAATGETGTITESSAPPVVGLSGCTGTVTAGGDAIFSLRDSFASLVPATMTWTTSDVNTVAGDYDGGTGTATIPAGNDNRDGTIAIHTHVNPPGGATRTFQLSVSKPQHATLLNGVDHLDATCSINQPNGAGSDKQPSIQLKDPAPVAQPATGSTPVTVTVTLNAPAVQPTTQQPVDVQWQTQPGSAVSPADYSDASGTLHWDKGTFGAKTFTVNVNAANGNATTTKAFTVKFTSTSAVFVGASVVNVTVVPPAAPPVLSVADASVSEAAGSVQAVVTLTPAATGTVTVKYATADGTAKAGADYSAVSGTLTFTAGQTSKTVAIPVADDNIVEANRAFTFTLSAPTGGATLGHASATMTIRNDDVASPPPPILSNNPAPTPNPTPVPTKQPPGTGKHVVLVQMLTGQSAVDSKGYVHYKLRCPTPAVKRCQGTIVLEVRMQPKKKPGAKKAPPLQVVQVGSGKFTITVNRTASVKVKVTKMGLTLLKTYKRMRVKATVKAKDTQNVKGVTAWIVSVQAPPREITVKNP
ncbi:MAG TPA: Calx-beta domain-containing protein [Gaiellaceae bacterium]|nr:Calx-beta domain-containing protein [Gaiellaceae bacterium]